MALINNAITSKVFCANTFPLDVVCVCVCVCVWGGVPLQDNPKIVDPSYMTDLDFGDFFFFSEKTHLTADLHMTGSHIWG